MNETKLKSAIRVRDGNKCVLFGMSNAQHQKTFRKQLEVHRVVPGSDYSLDAGACVSLCMPCHAQQIKSPHYSRDIRMIVISADLMRKARVIAAAEGTTAMRVIREVLDRELTMRFADHVHTGFSGLFIMQDVYQI